MHLFRKVFTGSQRAAYWPPRFVHMRRLLRPRQLRQRRPAKPVRAANAGFANGRSGHLAGTLHAAGICGWS